MGPGQPRGLSAVAALAAALLFPVAAQACVPVPANTYATGGASLKGAAADDPLYPRQWALEQIGAADAWAAGSRAATR